MNATDRAGLDQITRNCSAFDSFQALVDAPGYRPTIRCYDERCYSAAERHDLVILADAYDAYQAARGDDRRAYRGSRIGGEQKPIVVDPSRLIPGEDVTYHRNQGDREGTVLAVWGCWALIEYAMPSGVTYLNFVAADGSDEPGKYRTVSYKALSKAWRRKVAEQLEQETWLYRVRQGRHVVHETLYLRD